MSARVRGELQTWNKTTLDFVSDKSFSEDASTFRDHRLDVTFTHEATGTKIKVPGFFAADGDAADSNATSGNVWRVNFNAPLKGEWSYEASFRTGTDIAASLSSNAGRPVSSIDGETGTFRISATDKTGEDFRAKGMILQDDGTHYLQHQGDGDYFIRGGPGVPENFLASPDIDNTPGRHDYSTHRSDFESGGPTWDGGKGKGILGAIDYLADQGQNSLYVMLLTAAGDGKDVWPWAATDLDELSMNTKNLDPDITSVYDVSKLSQWEIIFDHMDEKGIYKNLLLQEQENDQLLNGGTDASGTSLSVERLIYMREMIARFGHNNGVQWNLSEETSATDQERKDMAEWAKSVDPYDHLIVTHTFTDEVSKIYNPLLSVEEFDGTSFQATAQTIRDKVEDFRDKSEASGDPWVLAWDEDPTRNSIIEPGANNPDSSNEKTLREAFWGTLTAGGSGVSWYIRASSGQSFDQNMDTFDEFESLWTWTAAGTDFFNTHIPFWDMKQADALTQDGDDFVMADPGRYYMAYLPYGEAGDVRLDLRGQSGETFDLYWYNPRTGGKLIPDGDVNGGSVVQVGGAPSEGNKDWVLLARNADLSSGPDAPAPEPEAPAENVPEPSAPQNTEGYFLEKNGLVKVQIEDIANGANPPSGWVYQNASKGDNDGFEGDGYYYWKNEANSTALTKQPDQGLITATVFIQEAGTYNLFLRSARDTDNPSDARNDIWVSVDGDALAVLPENSPPMVNVDGFVKLYGLHGEGTDWAYAKNFDDKNTNKNPASEVVLSEGMHTITFAGRSEGFHIDSFQLTKGNTPNTSITSSEYIAGKTAPKPAPEPEPQPDEPSGGQEEVGSAVNAGGSRFVAADGIVYASDSMARGGNTYATSSSVSGTKHDPVYQTERYGDFSYDIAVENGSYEVTLNFAEIYFDRSGERVFDIAAEGRTVIDDLDIFAEAGGKNIAYDVTIPVTVKDGKLSLEFTSEVNYAKINGISWAAAQEAPQQEAPEPNGAVAINSAGSRVTGADGTVYSGDSFASGGKTYETSASISGTSDDVIYQTERYGDFSYGIAVADGDYDVTLKFAEIYFGKSGERVFDVTAEGDLVLDDLDIFDEAGGKNAAYDVVVPVTVTDGKLDLEFISEVNNAKVNGIVISERGAAATPPKADPVIVAEPDDNTGAGDPAANAPFDLSGQFLEVSDAFLFGFGVDGKSADVAQSGGDIGIADVGSDTEIDYRKGSAAGSEKIVFDFAREISGIDLNLGGLSTVEGADEAAILRTYDANGSELDEYLVTSNSSTTLSFGEKARFASLESSPWITDGGTPSQEPDFRLEDFDLIL